MINRPEIISLLGIPYYAEPAVGEDLAKLHLELTEAEEALTVSPKRSGTESDGWTQAGLPLALS